MSDAIQAPTCSDVVVAGDNPLASPSLPSPGELANGDAIASPDDLGSFSEGGGLDSPPETEAGQTLTGDGSLSVADSESDFTEGNDPMESACSAQPDMGGDSPMSAGCIPCAAGPNGSLGKHVAGETIGGGRFVLFGSDGLLYKASGPLSLPAHGYIKQAVVEEAEVEVWQTGLLDGLVGLSIGDQYFLGTNGNPTATAPTTGILQPVGQAISATELAVDLEEPIEFE